jgi:hypothetical protein
LGSCASQHAADSSECGKGFLHECSIGRCGHVFGLYERGSRERWPRPALHYVLFALPTFTSRRIPDVIVQAASAAGSL